MNGGDWVRPILALLIVACICAFAVFAGIYTLPQANEKFLWFVLGAMTTKFSGVFDYYFGSSRSAERSADRLAAATPAAPPPTVAQVTADPEKKS